MKFIKIQCEFTNPLWLTLSAPYGGTSPRVGGIAKAVLNDIIESEL